MRRVKQKTVPKMRANSRVDLNMGKATLLGDTGPSPRPTVTSVLTGRRNATVPEAPKRSARITRTSTVMKRIGITRRVIRTPEVE